MIRKALLLGVLLLFPYAMLAQLGKALNAKNLNWSTSGIGGASGWFAQSKTNHDGNLAAASGIVTDASQSSILETTVTGPGTLTFWWYAPLGFGLSFEAGGMGQGYRPTGAWEPHTIYLGPGKQKLRWTCSGRNLLPTPNQSYLDEVTFTPGSTGPIIVGQPRGGSQVPGLNARFSVMASGTPPLHYQWQHEGTSIQGATAAIFVVPNIRAHDLGNYTVIVSNNVGSTTSSNALLEFGNVAAWFLTNTVPMPNGTSNIIALAGGYYEDLALRDDGTVFLLNTNPYVEAPIEPGLSNVIAIDMRHSRCAALKADGTVSVWDTRGFGGAVTNVPTNLTGVVQVKLGSYHVVALKSDGTVVSWRSTASDTNVPPYVRNVVMVAAESDQTLALKSDGTVLAWNFGLTRTNVPSGLSNVVAIAADSLRNVALRSDGSVFAWDRNLPFLTNVASGFTNVVAISPPLALKADGTVSDFGGGTNVPAGLTNAVEISASGSRNLALVANGPILHAALSGARMSNGVFSVSLPSQSGHVFALEYKESLTDSNWTMLPLVAGTGRTLTLTDPTAATGHQRFYRVRRW